MSFKIAVLAGALAFVAGSALAADVATLKTPVEGSRIVMAGEVSWRCEGDTCKPTTNVASPGELGVCRALVRQVGPLAAYTSREKAFDAARLARCNGERAG